MTEIDFDELDKAVGSIMNSIPQANHQMATAPDTAESSPYDIDSAAPANAPLTTPTPALTPAPVTTDPQPPEQQSTTDAPKSQPLATKRRGQFMDMKHSSANMKPKSSPSAFASRKGVNLTPSSNMPDEATTSLDDSPAFSTAAIGEEPTTAAESITMPDPIDQIPENDTAQSQPEEKVLATPTMPDQEPASVATPQPDQQEPSTEQKDSGSPFLADAKVEKRPLGQAAPMMSSAEAPSIDEVPAEPEVSEPTLPQITTSLPKELHEDVMSVEADTTMTQPDLGEQQAPENTDVVEQAPVSVSPAASTSASIPLQYKTVDKDEAAAAEQPASSMYDSGVDHAALAASPKKKSHWVIVVLILGLVLIGAGGGATVYMLQTGVL